MMRVSTEYFGAKIRGNTSTEVPARDPPGGCPMPCPLAFPRPPSASIVGPSGALCAVQLPRSLVLWTVEPDTGADAKEDIPAASALRLVVSQGLV